MFAGINGLLIPGGAVSIYSSPYARAATYLVDLARLSQDVGEVFPVWGSCLGFEMLGAISTGGQVIILYPVTIMILFPGASPTSPAATPMTRGCPWSWSRDGHRANCSERS